MLSFKDAHRTTVLLVDDDALQLELRALTLKRWGFSVLTAIGPLEAIAIMNGPHSAKFNVAVLDYHMPLLNGCALAEYFKSRHPELQIVLYSGAIDISEDELSSIDAFISKDLGIAALLAKIAEMRQMDPQIFTSPVDEN